MKGPYKGKYQFLINEWESAGSNHLNGSKAFISCLKNMHNVYKDIEECNTIKKRKILIVFHA